MMSGPRRLARPFRRLLGIHEVLRSNAANIPGVKTATVNTLSVYDILNYDKFIVSSEAVKKIEEVYA